MKKKKKIKNRKLELRNKRVFIGSIIIGSILIIVSTSSVLYRYFIPKQYVSPLSQAAKSMITAAKGTSQDTLQQVEQTLNRNSISYSDARMIDQNTCQITIDNNQTVLFATDRPLAEQIASLQLIVSHLTMEGKRFSRLDLRYDKPIIVFAQ